jgi:hypothetical protein
VQEIGSDYDEEVVRGRGGGSKWASDKLYYVDELTGTRYTPSALDVSQYEIIDSDQSEENDTQESPEESGSEYRSSDDDLRLRRITSAPSRQTRAKTATPTTLASKALSKIQKARVRGSVNVTLSHAELDALEHHHSATASSSTSLTTRGDEPRRSRKYKDPSSSQSSRRKSKQADKSSSNSPSPQNSSRETSTRREQRRRSDLGSFFPSRPRSRRRDIAEEDPPYPTGPTAGYFPSPPVAATAYPVVGHTPDGRPLYAMPMPIAGPTSAASPGGYYLPYGASSGPVSRRVVSEPQVPAVGLVRRKPVRAGSGDKDRRDRDRDRDR